MTVDHHPATGPTWRRLDFSSVTRLLVCLLVLGLAGASQAATGLERWRSEIRQTRLLAENNTPQAYQEAHRLQEAIPEEATPADQARLLNLHARIEVYLSFPEMAELHAGQAMALAVQHDDRIGQAEASLNSVLNASNQADLKAQVSAPAQALKILTGVDAPDLLAEAQLHQVVALYRQRKVDESVALAGQALEIASQTRSPLAMTHAHQGMAISHDQGKRPAEALRHYVEMRDWAQKAQSHILEAEAWLGISIQEDKLGNFAASENALNKTIEKLRPTGAAFAIARASLTLSDQNRPAEALRLLNEANTTFALRDTKIGMWWTLLARSKSHLALKRLPEALSDAQSSQSLAREIGLKTLLAQSAQQLSAVQAALGNYERAYLYATEAAGIKARLANERTDSYVTELAERDERESQQREIDELNRRSERQTAKEHWLWTIFAASLLLLTITTLFLLRQSRANRQLAILNTQLAQSRNRLQATHDALPDMLFELDLDGRYYDCHSPRSELLAAPVTDLIGKTMAEVLPPEVVEICMTALHEANEHGISTSREYSLALPRGKCWFEMSIARKTVPSGEAPHFICLAHDISERKLFEAREKIRLRTFELLAQGGEQQEILDLIASYVEEGRPDLLSSIMLVDDSGQYLHTVCAPRLPPAYLAKIDGIPVGEGIGACGTAAWRQETVSIDDIGSHPYWNAAKDLALGAGLLACWSEPIIGATGTLFGTFCIYRRQTGSPSTADLELARQASHLAAVAIERTRLAAALAASEQEFRTLAENSPDNIARYDTHCRVVYMNRQLTDTLGSDMQQSLGKTPRETNDIVLADYQARITSVIETGLADEIEIVLPDAGEGQHHHHIRLAAERADDGNIIGVLAIGRDITERKRIEANLAARELEFRTLAENMPDFVARYDTQCRKTYLNHALSEMIGDARASQLGTTPFESLPRDIPGLAEYEDKLRRTLSSGQPESMDGVVSRGPRQGEIHNLRFVAEHDQDGSIVGALVFSRDISELKRKERQIEESRDLLRELAARRDTAREEERKRIAREVHDELGQMLSVQRLEIATMKFQFGEQDSKLGERCQRLLEITDKTIQVVRNVATTLRPAALDMGIGPALAWLTSGFRQRTGIACQLLCAEEEIDLDEEQSIAIFRIVQESLTNITRYAEAQHVHIALESCGDNHYHLAIRDDGKGFDSAAKRSRSFGLIGIQERALMLGGEAHIFSTPGQGTAIEVKIPCHQTEKGFAS
ncbi:MAG: PAS domain-containing protein [Azonexus sp.]